MDNENGIENFDESQINSQSRIGDVNSLIRHSEANVVQMILSIWSKQHEADIKLRESYAKYLFVFLAIETGVVMLVFFLNGIDVTHFKDETIRIFLSLSYVKLIGMVYIIVKYLFSKDSHVVLKDIADILKSNK